MTESRRLGCIAIPTVGRPRRFCAISQAPRRRATAIPGWERVVVISGSQADAQGLIKAGDVAVNAPGTEHEVFSAEGCLALLVWERQPIMLE